MVEMESLSWKTRASLCWILWENSCACGLLVPWGQVAAVHLAPQLLVPEECLCDVYFGAQQVALGEEGELSRGKKKKGGGEEKGAAHT